MRRKAVTIRDVAKRANVGVSTVSYVLNGNEDHVGTATRDLILAAARDLNYRPNAIARSMVKQKTATIGLIITELQNPLFVPVTQGVDEVLHAEGYHIILASANDPESEIEAIETLRAQQVDGFIIMSLSLRFPVDHLMVLNHEDIPFVVINRDLDEPEINRIHFNDYSAGQIATGHLLSLGHSRIGLIGGPVESPAQRRSAVQRYSGWHDALTSHGLPVSEEWVVGGNYTFEGGYRAAEKLIADLSKTQLTALFSANDMMAMGALKAIYNAGLRIPDDLAFIAIGDPPFAAYTIPALTTLSMPVVESGMIAARILVDWLNGTKPEPAHHVTLDFTLQVRESCGAIRR